MRMWAEHWRAQLLDSGVDARRATQGRAFQRTGRVTGVRVQPGRVSGRVQGSRATPYQVEVFVPVLDDTSWEVVTDVIARQVRHHARLLAGEVPDGLDADVRAAGGRGLLELEGLEVRCACGAPDGRCAHAVALWEAVAERIASDPFVLFQIRGRGRERLLAQVGAHRRGAGADPTMSIHDLDTARWSSAAEDPAQIHVPRPAATDAGPLRLLGDPSGWAGGMSAWDLLSPLVADGARKAGDLLGEEA